MPSKASLLSFLALLAVTDPLSPPVNTILHCHGLAFAIDTALDQLCGSARINRFLCGRNRAHAHNGNDGHT